jgi:hypothetical protein
MYSNLAISVVHLYEAIRPGPPRLPVPCPVGRAANCRSGSGLRATPLMRYRSQMEPNAKNMPDRVTAAVAASARTGGPRQRAALSRPGM